MPALGARVLVMAKVLLSEEIGGAGSRRRWDNKDMLLWPDREEERGGVSCRSDIRMLESERSTRKEAGWSPSPPVPA